MSGDDAGEWAGQWLSYSDLAERRGISRESANRLVIRHRWHKRKGNDGRVRVFVPADHLTPDLTPDISPDTSPDATPDKSGDTSSQHIAMLGAAIAALEAAQKATLEALERERNRVNVAEARADRIEAVTAEREAVAQVRVDRIEARAEQDRAAAAEREGQLRGQVEALMLAAVRREPVTWRDVLAWIRKRGR